MSKMWERDIQDVTNKIETLVKHRDALQESFDRMLFPPNAFDYAELSNTEGLLESLSERHQALVEQNAKQDVEELKRMKAPLRPAADRDGFYRSQAARNAAILGILERERRLNAPLSREAWASRAQSIDARSRSFVGSVPQQYEYKEKVDPATGEVLDWMDPCVEYRTIQKMRRAAMFARGVIGRRGQGYHTSKRWSPC